MGNNLTPSQLKHKSMSRNWKSKNKYTKMGSNAVKQAVEDARRYIKWMDEHPGQAVPLGY